jgi:hypothetical protein
MTDNNPVLPHVLRARRWALVSASLGTLLVGLGVIGHQNSLALTVYGFCCLTGWTSVVAQQRSVRAARSLRPGDEC